MVAALMDAAPLCAKTKRPVRRQTKPKTEKTVAKSKIPARHAGAVPTVDETFDSPKHEMRGAWLASVYGIDWPSRQGVGEAVAQQQKKELTDILDILEKAGINAVMFQVRSMSDAMYASSFEPWSQYLTGERGTAPAAGWDPLEFAVAEAHRRGMELHAWVNPFRVANGKVPSAAQVANGKGKFDPVAKGWTMTYRKRAGKNQKGTAVCVLDPGNAAARKHIVDVCREIVTRYDVDGLIFDDYFYPDGLPLGSGYDFNEYKRDIARRKGEDRNMSQADWRRDNVARTISEVRDMLDIDAPWVRFGISPAGVAGGNGEAAARYGLKAPEVGNDWMYNRIYCDPLRWLADGSVDYVSPQLYWPSDHETNPYEPLARWWGGVAARFGRHCFPSQSVGCLPESDVAWCEQGYQVGVNRCNSTGCDAGSIFYSTAHITGKKMSGLGDYLSSNCYRYPALMPPMKWKKADNPGAVKSFSRVGDRLEWTLQDRMRYVVYAIPDGVTLLEALDENGSNFESQYIIGVTYGKSMAIPPDCLKGYWYAVAPYDRYGNEWDAAVLETTDKK